MNALKKLAPWRVLAIGQQVESTTYKRGASGTVKERLESRIDGLCRYGVVLDNDKNNTADFCRWELKPIRRNGQLQRGVL